jgi:four helix bundle protein
MRDHRQLPAFQATHELILTLHETVHRITASDAGGLTGRMRAAALSAAGAIVRGAGLPNRRFAGELEHAACRLREIGYYIDLAQRLGYLSLQSALELLERQTRARLEVAGLLEGLAEEEATGHLLLGSERAEVEARA